MKTLPPLAILALVSSPALAQSTPNVVLVNDLANPIAQGGADTRSVAWVDVDADGDLDLFTLDYAAYNHLYINEAGVFTELTQAPNELLDATVSKGVDFGDVDNDGDVDAFVANGNGRANGVLLNQGFAQGGTLGRFLQDPAIGGDVLTDSGHSYTGRLGDLDGDGNLDLIVANRYEPNLHYLGDGLGNFSEVVGSPVSDDADGSRDVALGDLDNDGDLDVVIVNSTHADNDAFVNDGLGGLDPLDPSDPLVSDGGTSYGVTLADLDADGLPEVLVSNRHAVNFLYRNVTANSALAFERVLDGVFSSAVGDSYSMAVGDLDDDGDADIVVANRTDASAVFLTTDAPYVFEAVTAGELVDASAETMDVELADVDGDGRPELALANEAGGANFLFRNLGAMWSDLGAALPGDSGPPALYGQGQLRGDDLVTLRVEQAAALAATNLVLGLSQVFVPFAGGVLVPSPDVVLPAVPTDGAGVLEVQFTYPQGLPAGFQFTLQAVVSDGGAVAGLAFTNGLQGTGL